MAFSFIFIQLLFLRYDVSEEDALQQVQHGVSSVRTGSVLLKPHSVQREFAMMPLRDKVVLNQLAVASCGYSHRIVSILNIIKGMRSDNTMSTDPAPHNDTERTCFFLQNGPCVLGITHTAVLFVGHLVQVKMGLVGHQEKASQAAASPFD